MFAKLFHKYIFSERLNIPQDRSMWPASWKTIFFKTYPRYEAIPLSKNFLELGDFVNILEKRTSIREFDTSLPIQIEELSTILHYAAGIKSTSTKKRHHPSGGGRYPLEVYMLANRVTGVPSGLYHYDVRGHALEHIRQGDRLSMFSKVLKLRDEWAKEGAAMIIVTAVWNRSFTKYKNLGYLHTLIEAGHLGQNLQLTATALNVASSPLTGFNINELQSLLDLNGDEEAPVYAFVLGK